MFSHTISQVASSLDGPRAESGTLR